MKRIVWNSVAVIVGMAAGFAAGALVVGIRFLEQPNTHHYFSFVGIGWGVSEGAFDDNSSDAKDLLQKNLVLLESGMDPRSELDPRMKKALLLQAALTKARLSIIEKKAGNVDLATGYMAAAQANLKSLGWLDYSAVHIERVVQAHRSPLAGAPPVKPVSVNLPNQPTK